LPPCARTSLPSRPQSASLLLCGGPLCQTDILSRGRNAMWGRLSSLRSAFQPAWLPFTHCPLLTQSYPAVEQAARLATPASPFSTQSCVPHRQPCAGGRLLDSFIPILCSTHSDVEHALLVGRLSSLRSAFQPAWLPFTHCPLFHPIVSSCNQAPAALPMAAHEQPTGQRGIACTTIENMLKQIVRAASSPDCADASKQPEPPALGREQGR